MSYISHEDYKSLMSNFQANTPKRILKEALDPVGKEDSDIDNDGDVDKTDKYLLKRRKAITKATGEKDVKEYGYADNYPGSWGYNEGREEEHSRAEEVAQKLKDEYGMDDEEVYVYLVDDMGLEGMVAQAVVDRVFGMQERKPHRSVTGRGIKESSTGDAPVSKMSRKDMIEFLGTTEEKAKDMSDEELRDAVVEKNEDMKEGLHMPPLQATGPTIDVVEDKLNVQSPEEVAKMVAKNYPDLALKMGAEKEKAALKYAHDEIIKSGLPNADVVAKNLINGLSNEDWPSDYLQALKHELKGANTLQEDSVIDAPFGVANPGMKKQLAGPGLNLEKLTSDERKQLGEFVDAIKTTKKAIEELLKKANGKDIKVKEDMGGNRTDLVMTPTTMSETEMDSEMYDRVEGLLDRKLHDAFEKVTGMIVKDLVADGFEKEDIAMYLKYEIEKKAEEAVMGQHD